MSNQNITARVKITRIEQSEGADVVHFSPVGSSGYPSDGSDENNSFAKFTPQLQFNMTVTNPSLVGKLKIGTKFNVLLQEIQE